MKKALLTGLSIALIAVVAVFGTLAYYTDRGAAANVFTWGNVDIQLNEDFTQGAQLIPGVDIEKKVTITNTGKNDAWVWTTIAIPAVLDSEDASKNVLHFNYSKESLDYWTWMNGDNWMMETETIDNITYNVYTVLYKSTLAAGATTETSAMTKVYLDTSVDIAPNGDLYKVVGGQTTKIDWNVNDNGNPIMYVSAYAIQDEKFDTIAEAWEAYGIQWGENGGAEYDVPTVTEVANEDDLTDALANNDVVVLNTDIDTTAPIKVDGSVLNGNGKTIDATDANTSSWGNYAVTLNNGGSVENTTVKNAFYAIGSVNTTEDLSINKVTVDDATYAINGNGNGTASVRVSNSEINGWISYSNIALLSFDNCKLATGNSYLGYLVVYGNTSFTDCTFEEFRMGARADKNGVIAAGDTITFTDCYYITSNGTVKVTAENFESLFYDGDDDDFANLKECNIIIDGIAVTW